MKFRTTKEKIFSALSETNKIIPIRTTLPILSCVLVEVKKGKNGFIEIVITDNGVGRDAAERIKATGV